MGQIAKALTEPEINALTQYLAGQPMPADSHPAPALAAPAPMRCGSLAP
jgi:cytochrome c553